MNAVTFLGTGEMGSALAAATLSAGYRTTVWNRTPGRCEPLRAGGADVAATVVDAVGAADVVVVCLLDHASVHDTLDPVAPVLAGRHVVNLTTTTPDGARELARWAAGAGIVYLDGGIMATPEMIGTAAATVFYSGARETFDAHRHLIELWGTAEYFGPDAGIASLYDLALLAAMYMMFAGFFHGAAMVAGAGVGATEFAERAVPWLQALAPSVAGYATVIDGGDYSRPGQQSLLFSDLTDIVDASRAQGISSELIDAVQGLIRRQIDAGHGDHGFARVIESIRKSEEAAA
ncbi:NAD(P)-binding domain-containing protein [Mycolicibacterium austroafricanum]|jgi:3-hydroxyisobutyrate dehydrogenase-like beta-hydroxyacid dehydrogenase|uniref:NAD(P)-binding domain-containing protein n=2 Tax=Mycolicibacterium TaxID=1866885 RepID=A0ABT8HF79_MYCAO|nr:MULTISPECIES: NAD(P)-binding domain-containing protein [Mycolicibacterium]MDN4519429.1 NAD(P)-binding domain-containing protein [Mycolicibacterium austroafricanum]QRZ06666.1 NAD(P)-dependent oxidoreductase [Mycolicibacterium austroafricanum]QZT68150.1 NAD(P)-binding domain-containing protein [Mycolicibacterium austroafricanum]UJL30440.1 NAD(P)-dependent oxidoreductase [Mycolicibacterium vanbaalenii]WND56463.1 NAD(P)-binding domain-containing protein [Mycolicibacterium vanbaalenii]